MRVAIFSDIHDHTENLQRCLKLAADTDVAICCGDLCAPFVILDLGNGYPKPLHIVFGNNDADLFRITTLAAQFPQIHLHGEFCELDIDGLRFAVNHFDNIAAAIGR